MYKLFGALQVCNSCGFWPLLVSVLVRKDSIVIGLEVCCSFGFFVKINHAVVGVLSIHSLSAPFKKCMREGGHC